MKSKSGGYALKHEVSKRTTPITPADCKTKKEKRRKNNSHKNKQKARHLTSTKKNQPKSCL
jgi:hypothetical protein